MKKNESCRNWKRVGLLLVMTATFGMLSAQGVQVELDVAMGSGSALANTKQTAYVRVAMTGFEYEAASARPPVNVAIVLDRSGSMSGEKLAKAKEAAIMVVDRLRPDDIISVVAYDTRVTVLVPATKVSDQESIHKAIRSLKAGSNTALFAGVSKGAAEVRKFLGEERVNRIILISDGLANEGPSSPGDLAELGASLIKEGVSVTTIGLGLDYNEDLMAALARKSDGNHMFAEKAQDLKSAFEREFGDMLSVVAKNVGITIVCEPGVRPVRALGREVSISGQRVYAGLNQIYGGQTKYILLEVELTSGNVGTQTPVAQVDLVYMNLASNTTERLQDKVAVNAADSQTRITADENPKVMEAVVYQVSVERNEFAMRLRDEGKIEEGKKVLRKNLEYLKSKDFTEKSWYMDNSTQLEKMDSDDSEWKKTR
ncbi:MAG: VWA domain-containing protein, partial [Candidatus Hydrogenedentes bacterium]|nr:VWA domain-containing protein [Candidatus Hydrogenedentota bacterium]